MPFGSAFCPSIPRPRSRLSVIRVSSSEKTSVGRLELSWTVPSPIVYRRKERHHHRPPIARTPADDYAIILATPPADDATIVAAVVVFIPVATPVRGSIEVQVLPREPPLVLPALPRPP